MLVTGRESSNLSNDTVANAVGITISKPAPRKGIEGSSPSLISQGMRWCEW